MNKIEKNHSISEIKSILNSHSVIVVAHYSGLTVKQMTELRREMEKNNANLKVVKNTLARVALEETCKNSIRVLFKGPVVLGYSTDAVNAPKVMYEFTKKYADLSILGGTLDSKFLNPIEVGSLAQLPSLDQLRAKILGLMKAPATKIAAISQEPAAKIVRVIKAYQNNS
jgi:large subunit ribosomal protein L10